jgi:hypothetical protein
MVRSKGAPRELSDIFVGNQKSRSSVGSDPDRRDRIRTRGLRRWPDLAGIAPEARHRLPPQSAGQQENNAPHSSAGAAYSLGTTKHLPYCS